ncbi:hypothetical protein [Winogradskyella sp.]|uniref:hypothetical protein n=1 Tax=Winogradskyella sp. TaxID=1883156 RepID=UPI003BA9890A
MKDSKIIWIKAKIRLSAVAILFAMLLGYSAQNNRSETVLEPTFYELSYHIDVKKELLSGSATITIKNNSEKSITEIPFLLYKLFEVTGVELSDVSIDYKQEVKPFDDWNKFRANAITIKLPNALDQKQSISIRVYYKGTLKGYEEAGLHYLKDNINPSFIILRPDCLTYPIIGAPNISSLRHINTQKFNYRVSIDVPKELHVVCGGKLVKQNTENESKLFLYESHEPDWRIDITIAKYKIYTSKGVTTYAFDEDLEKAKLVHKAMEDCMDLLTSWWGDVVIKDNFKLIQIPEGYGSQAGLNYILQTSAAFDDKRQLKEVYHEISHLWDVKNIEKFPSRWNEGLAMYSQFKVAEVLDKDIVEEDINKILVSLYDDTIVKEVAFKDYGYKNVTVYSYKVGLLFFWGLNELLGNDEFNALMKAFRVQYSNTGATAEDFIAYVKKNTLKSNIGQFIQDWYYTTDCCLNLNQYKTITDIVNKYKI